MKTKIEVLEHSVIKHCNSLQEFQNELKIYQLNLSITPKLIAQYSDLRIEIEKLKGSHPGKITQFFLCLECLIHFHQLTLDYSICHTDPCPKNFICSEGCAYIIDFSQIETGAQAKDIIAFFLFLVDILPIEDLDQMGMFFKNNYSDLYDIDRKIIDEECQRFDIRRKEYKRILKLSVEQKTKRQRILSYLINKG